MLTREHVETAQRFLDDAEDEFAGGDVLQGSDKIWGAVSHAVIAIAQQRGWMYGDHRSLKVAVRRLAKEHDDPLIESAFGLAEKFHANFYHGFMQDFELEDRPLIRRFVIRMQRLLE